MKKIQNKAILSYALLAFPITFLMMPVYMYLPNYYQSNFNIPLTTVGIILLVVRIFDAILWPLLGMASDYFTDLKRKVVLISAPILGISFILLFNPLSTENIPIWIFSVLCITYLFFNMIQINYQSLAIGFSKDYNEITKIIASRQTIGVTAIICASVVPSLLFSRFSEVQSFLIIGICCLILFTIFSLIFYFKSPEASFPETAKKLDFRPLKSKSFRPIFTIFFFNSISFGCAAALMLFFVESVLNAKEMVSLFLSLYFGGLLFGIPFWSFLAKKLNSKSKSWRVAMILNLILFSLCLFIREGDVVFYAALCLTTGFCFGADYCISFSVLTDIIQKEKSQKMGGTIFGLVNFITKSSFAVVSGSILFFLGKIQTQAPHLELAFILTTYCAIPCLFKIFTLRILYKNPNY